MRRRPVLRLVDRIDAAARRAGMIPVTKHGAARVAAILVGRSLCRGDWWMRHEITRVRPPRQALLWQAIDVFRERAAGAT